MKRLSLFSVVCFLTACLSLQAEPMELRGVWVSTVANIDFPSRPGISVAQMKQEADTYLDTAKALGFNAIIFQTRPMGDAMYPSKIYPWSGFLTGKQGEAPAEGFDPLKYWIDGAHARGMQLHAWCNPYRVTHGRITKDDLDPNNPAVLNPEWTFERDGRMFLDPGIPEVRQLVISGLVEIVTNYDVDGVHFDDYFYPARNMDEDAETFKKYGGEFTSIEEWRRNNVDLLVKEIHEAVKNANPKALWGISPAGIWANQGNDPARLQHPEGSATRGNSTYYALFADTKKWVEEGWLDYIVPQIYWHIGFEIADFITLADWWDNVCAGTNVKLYIGMAAYRVDPNSTTAEAWKTPDELIRQLDYLKTKPNVNGFVMFTMNRLKAGTAVNKALTEYFGDTPISNPKVNKSVYVYLSPSSQNANIGFGDYLSEEYRMNQLAQHLKKQLLEAGVKVLPDLPPVTKQQLDDRNYNRVSLRDRMNDSMRQARELERTEPDALFYHIALHTNAFNRTVRGAEVFVDMNNSPEAAAMAEHLLAASVALYHKENPEVAARLAGNARALRLSRGVKDTVAANLGEARATNTKNGMLFEFCFHDEEHDSQWMLRCIAEGEKEGGTNPLAKVLVDALVEFVNRR